MKLPAWIKPLNLLLHVGAGIVLTYILSALGTPPLANLIAVGAVGVAHELGDGDLTTAPAAPWNGILDVLAFLPGPLVRLLW